MSEARPLVATYRLQLQRGFGFAEASAAVPYLATLGVSHLYLSPTWQAAAGSTHGYDVVDHARISHELGGPAGFLGLAEAAHRHGLGIVVDLVPNHVGIAKGEHPWWRDVLRYGPASPYAGHFDIDWEGQPQMRAGVLLVPSLGRPFGEVLEAGELTLDIDDADLVVRYYDASFPLAPRTYHLALGLPTGEALEGADASRVTDVAELLDRLRDAAPEQADVMRVRLVEHLRSDEHLGNWARTRLQQVTGTVGDATSFDRMDDLMREQSYRLASWRVSGEETNYRRFFDVNDLAAIREENEAVFTDTHRLVHEFLGEGLIDGLRVDHVDGLYDPAQYLERLKVLAASSPAGGVPTWVEKILGEGEELPPWPVSGTTGYEFLATVGNLLVDRRHAAKMTEVYDGFTGVESDFRETAFAARERIADRGFAGEVAVLALQLHRLGQRHRRYRDNTLRSLRDAIAGLIACFPVYRTYLDHDEPRPGDRELIETAAREAQARNVDITPESMSFLLQVLLLQTKDGSEERTRWVHFRRRLQQVAGPVMAKGVEDTTFFRYHRLLALNEVGAHPEQFGVSIAEAHRQIGERGERWPDSLLASSTHDTKRSEDGRARLLVLSEMPDDWAREVRLWQRGNQRWKKVAGGRHVPGPNTEYYLYQSLIAAWPERNSDEFRERMCEHMRKAMRESKVHTSWAHVDEPYEEAVLAFVRAILDERKSAKFIERVERFVDRIAGPASANSLAMVALKCLAPGVPDFYQGSELPLFTLTDPDNRRQVDFGASLAAFEALGERPLYPALGASKHWLTAELLKLRRERTAVFADGSNYRPLVVTGRHDENLFGFAREAGDATIATVVMRLSNGLVSANGRLRALGLPGTGVEAPFPGRWRNVVSGVVHDGPAWDATEVMRDFPVAVLVREDDV